MENRQIVFILGNDTPAKKISAWHARNTGTQTMAMTNFERELAIQQQVSSILIIYVAKVCRISCRSISDIFVARGLYYKHIKIIYYDSSITNKLGASLTEDAIVVM